MNARERVMAALRGAPVDRPPVSFWGHVYHRESSAADLVEATLERWRTFRWDWIKLNPRRHYHAEPWGTRFHYSGRPNEKPVLEHAPVGTGPDWATITERPAEGGALGEQIEAVRMLRAGVPHEIPILATVFTPLAILREMVPDPSRLRADLDTHPELVRSALAAVTATFERLVPKLLQAGADGIFFATVDWATEDQLTAEQYRAWARPTDLRLLRAADGASFNVLHVCKRRNLLGAVADYPVRAFSWAATDPTNPSLADGLRMLPGAVMGGISHEGALQAPAPEGALAELRRAFEQTAGRRWLVAPGCSIPPATPDANLLAVRAAVEELTGAPAAEPEARA